MLNQLTPLFRDNGDPEHGQATLSLSVAGNAKSAIYNISILADGATILVPVAVVP